MPSNNPKLNIGEIFTTDNSGTELSGAPRIGNRLHFTTEGDAIRFDTSLTATNGPYRLFTLHNAADTGDQVMWLSYNSYRNADGSVTKDVAGVNAFHMVWESNWGGTVEWNLDLIPSTRAGVPTRRLAFIFHDSNERAQWGFITSGAAGTAAALQFSVGTGPLDSQVSIARWSGSHSAAAMQFEVKNEHADGFASAKVFNQAGMGGGLVISLATAGGTALGDLDSNNLLYVLADNGTTMAVGTSGGQAVNFFSNNTRRGRIHATTGDLEWLHEINLPDGGWLRGNGIPLIRQQTTTNDTWVGNNSASGGQCLTLSYAALADDQTAATLLVRLGGLYQQLRVLVGASGTGPTGGTSRALYIQP